MGKAEEGHPAFIPLEAEDGTLYQPSNGTEGDIFISFFCSECIRHPISHDAKSQCQILMRTFALNTKDPEYPKQWCYKKGKPTCTAFRSREEVYQKRRDKRRHKKTRNPGPDLFD